MLILTLPSQEYMVDDAPFIQNGVISEINKGVIGSRELLFATIRATNNNAAELLRESTVELNRSSFDFKFKDPILRHQFGKMWVRGYFLENTEITLNGNLDSGITTADLTVASGSVPDKGFCLIDNEVCEFEKLTDTSISVDRGFFETEDSNHNSGTAVGFNTNNETCIPSYGIEFETQEGDLFKFRNAQFRGGVGLNEFLRSGY